MPQVNINVKSALTFLVLSIAVSGCSNAAKVSSREPVQGAESPMVQSMFAPEPVEACTALGHASCSYFQNPLKVSIEGAAKAQMDSCVSEVLPKANADKADYIYIDTPDSLGVGMISANLSSPKATWYKCGNLKN